MATTQNVQFQRQYVGARYVPKIATPYQWDPQTVYEPLTIVGNAGSSYTSKKLVPAGTDINNEEYWALTGNLNGGIQQLQTQVNEQGTAITANTAAIASNKQSIQIAKDDIAILSNKIDNIKLTRNILLITDSYGTSSGDGTPFTTAAKTALLKNPTISNVYVIAAGGSGFTQNTTFQMQFDQWAADNPNTLADLTDVYVLGGANDQTSFNATTLTTAINNFFADVKAKAPYAKIGVAACTKGFATNRQYITGVYETYEQATQNNGGEFDAELSVVMQWEVFLKNDRVHPTSVGNAQLAESLVGFVLGNTAPSTQRDTRSITFADGIITLNSVQIGTIGIVSAYVRFNDNATFTNQTAKTYTITETLPFSGNNGSINFVQMSLIENRGNYAKTRVVIEQGVLSITTDRDVEFTAPQSMFFNHFVGSSLYI